MGKFQTFALWFFAIVAFVFGGLFINATLADTARLKRETTAINAQTTQIMATVQAQWTPTPTAGPTSEFVPDFTILYRGSELAVHASQQNTGYTMYLYTISKPGDLQVCHVRTVDFIGNSDSDTARWNIILTEFCRPIFGQ
jgi:hypothetical protein